MKKQNLLAMVSYALVAALLCILAPMSVPIGPVPISLTNLVLYVVVFIVGTRGSLISFCVYLLLGMVGLPVFSGYQGGLGKLAGPTGGYIIGFIPMILIMGLIYFGIARKKKIALDMTLTVAGMIVGTIVAYALGTVWFVFQMDCDWGYAMSVCVIPFIPFDLGKIVLANILGRPVRKVLLKQGFIQ